MERTIGLVVHRSKAEALDFAAQVIVWLEQRGFSVRCDEQTAQRLGRPTLTCGTEGMEGAELLLTLGGDGTILTAARLAAPCGVPILGVHMGRFGFIAETHPDDLFPHLEAILSGRKRIVELLMVQAEVWRAATCVYSGIGLNEAMVKSSRAHLLHLRTFLGGVLFANYPADGLIVATPTGSTAYALSAGGPVVEPTVQALLLVPNNPHTLSARPLVVPCHELIEIEVESEDDDVIIAVDSQEPFTLQSGDRIRVRRSDYTTRLIVLDPASFYRKVRNRYLYGERTNG